MSGKNNEWTKKERVEAVMNMEEPDKVPIYPYILTHGVYTCGYRLPDITTQTKMDVKKSIQTVMKTLEVYDYDMVIGSYQDLYYGLVELGGEISIPNKFGGVVAAKRHPVSTPDDWERVQQLLPLDPRKSGRMKDCLESYKGVSELIGKTHPIVPCWWPGPTAAMCMLRGPEALTMDMLTEPDFAHEMIKAANDITIDFIRGMYENGANSVTHTGEIYGVELIDPNMCREFVVPYVKDIAKMVNNEFGQKLWLHTHGDYKPKENYKVLVDYIETSNIAGFHPDEKHPAAWLKSEVKDKFNLTIAGILHGPGPLMNGPLEQIRSETKEIIDVAGEGGGLMLAPSCELPPDVPEDNFREWISYAHAYGTYSKS